MSLHRSHRVYMLGAEAPRAATRALIAHLEDDEPILRQTKILRNIIARGRIRMEKDPALSTEYERVICGAIRERDLILSDHNYRVLRRSWRLLSAYVK